MASHAAKEQHPCTIPASPNWYCSGIASCNNSGHFAFAARNSIYLVDLEDPFHTCKAEIQLRRERVTSVCLLPVDAVSEQTVAFASEDHSHFVKIWDCESKKVVKEHKRHQVKINVITAHETKSITSGDDKGMMITWNYETDHFSSWMPVASTIMSLAACPHSQWMTLAGYANGHVLVCNVKKQEIIQHFKSHIDEVHSVVWCPSSQPNLLSLKGESQNQGYLLASSSRDKTIKVWNTSQENSLISLTLSNKTSAQKGRKKFDDASRTKIWISLCWWKADTLISSSFSGEILVWDLNTKDYGCIAPAHNRMIFTISIDYKSDQLITSSMDRQIMFWKADTHEYLNSLPSLGGYVYSLAVSVLDPYCIVYGVGDNLIRVWNTRSSEQPYNTSFLWQGIKSKVTVVTCHRTKESVIGFGTDDGHVGVYNTISRKVEVSASYHKKTVYSLSWGPSCDCKETGDGNWLFSCGGEGSILVHSMHNLQNKARDLNTIIKSSNGISSKEKMPSRSDVEWKPDLIVVALGNEDGSIEIFSAPNLQRLCVIQVHRKIINCLEWHHECHSLHNDTGSNYSCWLASGSSDNYVCITDLTQVLDSSSSDEKSLIVLKDKFRYFNSHAQRITDLSWNVHTVGILASSSFDGTVQVWNVIKNEPIANFRGHSGKVLCVLWSYVDKDIVYSGGEDFTLRRWIVSDCQHKTPPASKKSASSQKTPKATKTESPVNGNMALSSSAGEVLQDENIAKIVKSDSSSPTNKLDSEASVVVQGDSSVSFLADGMRDATDSSSRADSADVKSPMQMEETSREAVCKKSTKKKKHKSLFPLFSTFNHKQKAASQNECVLLARHLKAPKVLKEKSEKFTPGKGEFVNLGLFADRLSAFKMFNEEGDNHGQLGNMEQQLQLELWKGNIDGAFEICQKKGELNEMVVAMSPLGGFDLWQSAMEAYADQLATNNDFHAAATYYLAINKVQETIEMFKKQNMYREAIAVAKVRLSSNDPTLLNLYRVWGEKLSSEGCFEHAAKCFLACGCHEEAIAILSKKGDVNSLKTAAKVAIICEKNDVAQELGSQTVDLLHLEIRFADLPDLLTQLENCKEMTLLSITHECLLTCLRSTEADTTLEISENLIENGWKNSITVSESTVTKLKDVGYMHEHIKWNIVDVVCCLYYEQFEDVPKMDILQKEPPYVPKQCQFKTSNNSTCFKKMLLQVSEQLMYGILYVLQGDTKEGFQHWLHAIELCYTTHQYDIVERIYVMLFPRDFITLEEFNIVHPKSLETRGSESCEFFRNFLAFYYSAVMYKLWWRTFPDVVALKNEGNKSTSAADNDSLNQLSSPDKCNVSLLQEYAKRLRHQVEFRFSRRNLNCEEFSRLLSTFSSVMISFSHSRVSQIRQRIAEIDQTLMETKIKKQLRQHIKLRSKELKKNEKRKEKQSPDVDQNWRAQQNEKKEVDDVTGEKSEVEVLGRDLDVLDDLTVVELTKKSVLLKEELDRVPLEIKDCPFPDSIENAKILSYMSRQLMKKDVLGSKASVLSSLVDDLTSWGLKCCLTEASLKYFQEQKLKNNQRILK